MMKKHSGMNDKNPIKCLWRHHKIYCFQIKAVRGTKKQTNFPTRSRLFIGVFTSGNRRKCNWLFIVIIVFIFSIRSKHFKAWLNELRLRKIGIQWYEMTLCVCVCVSVLDRLSTHQYFVFFFSFMRKSNVYLQKQQQEKRSEQKIEGKEFVWFALLCFVSFIFRISE